MDKARAERRTYIEFLRIFAAFMVIANHTLERIAHVEAFSASWYLTIGYFFASKVAVPLFVMISGALLLGRREPLRRSAARLLRIVAVAFVFSAGYFLWGNRDIPMSLSLLGDCVGYILRQPATNAYWYLYLYIGLLAVMPILQAMASALSKREMQLLLLLSLGIGGGLPFLQIFFPTIAWRSEFMEVLLSPYIGMLFAGLYVERHVRITGKTCLLSLLVFALLTAFQMYYTGVLRGYSDVYYDFMRLDNRIFPTITVSAICVYIMAKYLFTQVRWPQWMHRAICALGALTFGVYLLSDFMMGASLPMFRVLYSKTKVLLAAILWQIVIFASAALCTWAMKKIPGIRKLI